MKPFINVRGLARHYQMGGTVVRALDGLDLDIQAHTLTVVMGPSGSGKSTLLNLLGAIETPSSGQVLLEGKDVATLDDTERTIIRRRRIGFIFQAFNLLPSLTALENVALPGVFAGLPRELRARRALKLLNALGMIGLRYRFGGNTPESGLDCSGFVRYVFNDTFGFLLTAGLGGLTHALRGGFNRFMFEPSCRCGADSNAVAPSWFHVGVPCAARCEAGHRGRKLRWDNRLPPPGWFPVAIFPFRIVKKSCQLTKLRGYP